MQGSPASEVDGGTRYGRTGVLEVVFEVPLVMDDFDDLGMEEKAVLLEIIKLPMHSIQKGMTSTIFGS